MSARRYWESALGFYDVKGVTVPAAVGPFPRELYQAPRNWVENAYPNLIYLDEVDAGNDFAAPAGIGALHDRGAAVAAR